MLVWFCSQPVNLQMLIRALLGLLTVLMLLFGGVQYNDPDGLMWMGIYAISAFWCGLRLFKSSAFDHKPVIATLWLSVGLAVVGVIFYWPMTPQFWTKQVWYNVETAREGMGLMIVFFVLMFVMYSLRVENKPVSSNSLDQQLTNN